MAHGVGNSLIKAYSSSAMPDPVYCTAIGWYYTAVHKQLPAYAPVSACAKPTSCISPWIRQPLAVQ